MKKERARNKFFTKEEIKGVAKLWKTSSKEEIAVELKITPSQVTYLAMNIRKAGYPLPRKRKVGYINFLVKEAVGELVEEGE